MPKHAYNVSMLREKGQCSCYMPLETPMVGRCFQNLNATLHPVVFLYIAILSRTELLTISQLKCCSKAEWNCEQTWVLVKLQRAFIYWTVCSIGWDISCGGANCVCRLSCIWGQFFNSSRKYLKWQFIILLFFGNVWQTEANSWVAIMLLGWKVAHLIPRHFANYSETKISTQINQFYCYLQWSAYIFFSDGIRTHDFVVSSQRFLLLNHCVSKLHRSCYRVCRLLIACQCAVAYQNGIFTIKLMIEKATNPALVWLISFVL